MNQTNTKGSPRISLVTSGEKGLDLEETSSMLESMSLSSTSNSRLEGEPPIPQSATYQSETNQKPSNQPSANDREWDYDHFIEKPKVEGTESTFLNLFHFSQFKKKASYSASGGSSVTAFDSHRCNINWVKT